MTSLLNKVFLPRSSDPDQDWLARAFHSADFSVPCPWRRQPFDKCFMRDSHRAMAQRMLEYLRSVEGVGR